MKNVKANPKDKTHLHESLEPIYLVALSQEGSFAITSGADNAVTLWDTNTG